jgi:pyruvate/2-oxoglutarate dehydrogenase complex dihydrolipoamide dehydrogenase (E3) component
MPDWDLAVIGAGSAGLSVAYGAARLGLRVALIERGAMGGDCLNAGCVPSKALLACAHAARRARGAGRFGVQLPAPRIDWDGVRAHVRGTIAAIAPADSEERYRGLGAEVIRASARFVAPDAILAGGRRLTARRFVVAAGSRPAIPPVPGLDAVPHLTNETLFDLPERPGHLLILGGGPVGLEMAQAHAGLGCRVTLVESGPIAPREDPQLVAGLRAVLREEGVALHENAAVIRAETGPVLVLEDGTRLAGTHLLVAAGRRPNIEDLDLPAGNVAASARGIATDAGLRSTSNRRVFAAGDIADPAGIGPRAFTHVGSYHAGIVIRRAVFRLPGRVDYRALPRVTYTDPELAQVGLTEAEARAAGMAVGVHRFDMRENDRAIAEGAAEGMAKLVMAGGRLVGAGVLAPGAGEMIGVATLAIGQRLKASALAGMIVPYPTRAEALKRAAAEPLAMRLFSARGTWLARLLMRV